MPKLTSLPPRQARTRKGKFDVIRDIMTPSYQIDGETGEYVRDENDELIVSHFDMVVIDGSFSGANSAVERLLERGQLALDADFEVYAGPLEHEGLTLTDKQVLIIRTS